MAISFTPTTFQFSSFASVRNAPRPETTATPAMPAESTAEVTARFGRTLTQVKSLRESLVQLDQLARGVRTLPPRAARVWSSTDLGFGAPAAAAVTVASYGDLGLLAAATPAVLRSSAEVNATPTSFTPFGPDWMGSTLQPTVSGSYNGVHGTGTLTFKVINGGTRGVNDLKLEVYDPLDVKVATVDIKKSDPPDQQYTLVNGLVLTFGEGDMLKDDTFTVDVTAGVPGSYTPAQPVWAASSTLATVGGVYDGSNGTGTLTFLAATGGTHGVDDLTIEVYDPLGSKVDTLGINKADPLDQEYTLSNGLTLSIGAGDLLKNTTFTVDVYDAVGSVVDPTKPLDGTRNANPNLENGLAVSPGAFEVNGVSIAVNAGDSIDDVLARITQSAAGVSASFDAATEGVVLTQTTPGSAPGIVVGNDTSGFLAATKLAGATVEPGLDRDATRTLASVGAFASVQAGTVSVNGVDIAIDPAADTLLDVLARINASGAGVTAFLNPGDQRVVIDSDQAGVDLVLDGGTTGLFAALNVVEGTHAATAVQEPGTLLSRLTAFSGVSSGTIELNGVGIAVDVDVDTLDDLIQRINAAGAGVTASLGGDRLTFTRHGPSNALTLDEGGTGFFSALGIEPGTHQPIKGRPGLSSVRAEALSAAVAKVAGSMNALFARDVLGDAVDPALVKFRDQVGRAVGGILEPGGSALETRFGLGIDLGAENGKVFDFSTENRRRFQATVMQRYQAVQALLVGLSSQSGGLTGRLAPVLENAERDLLAGRSPTGLLLDAFA